MTNKIDDFLIEIFFKQKKKTKIRELNISLCQVLLENFAIKLFPLQFNEVEKQGVIAYSTDRENEASTMFIRKRNGIINNCEICMTAQSLFSSHVFFQVAFVKSLMTIPYFPEVHRF